MTFAGVMTGINALPASAGVIHEEVVVASLQSFTAPDTAPDTAPRTARGMALGTTRGTAPIAALPPVVRDDYTMSYFSVVTAPVPLGTPISSGFGYRHAPCSGCSSQHRGVDFTPGFGYPILAVADGVVSETGNPSGELGVHLVINHVVDGVAVSSVYGHMRLGSMGLHVGDKVSRGQVIGAVGSTGQSTGPHLHFGILLGGTPIDPYAWLQKHVNA